MPNLAHLLFDAFKETIQRTYPELEAPPIDLVQATNDKFGHYQVNSAMKLAKLLKLNPRQVAEQIVKNFGIHLSVEKLEIAGPGFINITLAPSYLSQELNHVMKDPRLGVPVPAKLQKVIVEFSSPNTAKEMHVGHLRSTIIGDSLARLFEFLGHDVLRLNHIGDWGTQFGMLIAYMQEHAPEVLTGDQNTDLSHLTSWYKKSKAKFDSDPEFKKLSQQKVVALQGGDPQALKAWNLICDISRKAYHEIYGLLDIKITERGESFYNPFLAKVVEELEQKGLVQISEGAKCIYLEGFDIPMIVQKSDGGYNYATTDMAALRFRTQIDKADRIIYVIDSGQSLHMRMVFLVGEKAGYLDPEKTRAEHVAFGLVLGTDGKKFRTRSGETEKLIDLLNAAVEYADTLLRERSPDMPEEERHPLAHALGLAAVKYADLSVHRISDYAFSYEKMLKFEGNTAAYLMYSYVRVSGIKRKVGLDVQTILNSEHIRLEHPSEIQLGLHLLQFSEALEQMSQDLLPNRLTDYLYTLAEKFNVFFRDCRVEGSPQQNSRLLLCEVVARVLQTGLSILGIKTVDRM